MARAIPNIKKSRGRPRIDATPIGLRIPPPQLARLDAWIANQPDPKPTRPEAIRRLIETGLKAGDPLPIRSTKPSRGGSDQDAETSASKPVPRKPRAKALAISKEAQIRALRERDAR